MARALRFLLQKLKKRKKRLRVFANIGGVLTVFFVIQSLQQPSTLVIEATRLSAESARPQSKTTRKAPFSTQLK
jgi:hypothetical protein